MKRSMRGAGGRRGVGWFVGAAALASVLVGCGSEDTPQDHPSDGETPIAASGEAADPAARAEKLYAQGLDHEVHLEYEQARESYIQAQTEVKGYKDTAARVEALTSVIAAKAEYERAKGAADPERQAKLAVAFANALRSRPAGQRNLHGAEALLTKAAELAPDSANVELAMSRVAAERGDFDASVELNAKAAQADPKSAEAHYNLAFLYRTRMGGDGPDPNKALEEAKLAVDRSKNDPRAYYYEMLAVCHHDVGDLDQAIEALEEAMKLAPDVPRYAKRHSRLVYERDGPPPTAKPIGPAEPKPAEPLPGDDVPAKPKPAEPKPLPGDDDDMPLEPKPVEPKPTEPKPVEPKPVEPAPLPGDDDDMGDDDDLPPADQPKAGDKPKADQPKAGDEPKAGDKPKADEPKDEPLPGDDDDDLPGLDDPEGE